MGGLRLGDPILDGALWVECDDAGAARDLLTDERLRGDLLALFCEHPGAVLADGQIAIRYVVGLELPGYIHAARGLPFYVPAQIAAARRAALALAEALEARSASEVAAEATARSARKTPVRTAR